MLLSDGTISFKANAPGAASFTYTVTDGHGGTASAVVKLQVTKSPASNPHLIVGTPAADILYSTTADETFIGKAGNDTFVFRAHSGRDQINDFQTGTILNTIRDVLDLRSKGFTGYDDLIDHVHRSGHDTLITFDDGGSVCLKGITPNSLQFDNFRLF